MAGNVLNIKTGEFQLTSSTSCVLQGTAGDTGFWINSIALEGFQPAGGVDPVIHVTVGIINSGNTPYTVGTTVTPTKVNRFNPATIHSTWLVNPATQNTAPTDYNIDIAFQPQISREKQFPHNDRGIFIYSGDTFVILASATVNAYGSFCIQVDE
jgi:hypothetical protein